MVQILLSLLGCVTLASPGTSLSLGEDKVNTGKSLHLPPAWTVGVAERQPLRGVAG